MTNKEKHTSSFYFEYHRIGNNAYRERVAFFEMHQNVIQKLVYEERIDIVIDYVICLFEVGKYHAFLSKVDKVIELVIMDNIFQHNDVNIYNHLLLKKAASLYNTGQYNKAEKILLSLSKIDENNESVRLLYGKCHRISKSKTYNKIKSIAILFFLIGGFTTFLQVLVIDPFYHQYLYQVSVVKAVFLIAGLLVFIGNELQLRHQIAKTIGFKVDRDSFMEFLRL